MAYNERVEYVIQVVDRVSSKLDKIERGFKSVDSQVNRTNKNMASMGRTLRNLGIAELARRGISTWAKWGMELESNKVQFESMSGSAVIANRELNNLNQMAAKTPFSNSALIQASVTLQQFGVSTTQATEDVKDLSAVSGGSTYRLRLMSNNLAQIASQGRATTRDIRELSMQGFNPLLEISRVTGVSMATLAKKVEAGEIGITEIRAAMKSIQGEGGRLNGILDKLSKTFEGRLNTATGLFRQTMSEIALTIMNKMKPAVEVLVSLAQTMLENKEVVIAVIAGIVGLGAAFAATTAISWLWNSALVQVIRGQMTLNAVLMANPIGLVVTAIGVLIGVLVYFYQTNQDVRNSVSGVWEVMKRLWEIVKALFTDFSWSKFGDLASKAFDKLKDTISRFVNTTFAPFVKSWAAFKEGRFGDAAMELGKGLFNLSGIGTMINGVNAVIDTVTETSAYKRGVANATQIVKKDGTTDTTTTDDKTTDDGGGGGNPDADGSSSSMSASGGARNVTINIENFGLIGSSINTDNDIKQLEGKVMEMLTSVLNDVAIRV